MIVLSATQKEAEKLNGNYINGSMIISSSLKIPSNQFLLLEGIIKY